jgi:phosphatidylserine/phosphatidylglycerophosphate/cardiolipin synthase-like enzyme
VVVRVVYNSSTSNYGIDDLNSSIGKISSPTGDSYGIMHNKFIVIDANSDNANDPVVWTGSTNLTSGQMNTDPNDVIIIQDKSLALAYTMEFNEMFGSAGSTPNGTQSKFGPDKEDNTPHIFSINGKTVESYFSPSDNTNQKIIDAINSGDVEFNAATMLVTREDIAKAIRARKEAGVDAQMVLDEVDSYTQDQILVTALGEDFRVMGESGLMHHKYVIVDHSTTDSDPIVLTGCHNWSSSAKDRNDENTLIVHDQDIANQYYQEFVERFSKGEIIATQPVCLADSAQITPDQTTVDIPVLQNDTYDGQINVEITQDTDWGIVTLNTDNTITYRPKVGFDKGVDSVKYAVCADGYPSLCDEATVWVDVNLTGETSVKHLQSDGIIVYPSVSNGKFMVQQDQITVARMIVLDPAI